MVDGLVSLSPGMLFAGDFRVVRPLSAGGMGAVYVVEQLSTSKPRALKIMRPELVPDDEFRRRFEREARVGANIASDHIVEVIGAGVDASTGMPWLAMELLTGRDLESYARAMGPIPVETFVELFQQLTHALAAAHDAGIVHRDLKPENIFLADLRRADSDFIVKILDFGIAKTLADAKTRLTAAMGTPLWMSPEQTSPTFALTPAADVWPLGLIAFRLLTGKLFWRAAHHAEASAMMIMREVLMDPIPTASERAAELGATVRLPNGFDAWFARCVEREAARRFQNGREAIQGLTSMMRESVASNANPAPLPVPLASATAFGRTLAAPDLALAEPAGRAAPPSPPLPAPLPAPLPVTARVGPAWLFYAIGGGVIAGVITLVTVLAGRGSGGSTSAENPASPPVPKASSEDVAPSNRYASLFPDQSGWFDALPNDIPTLEQARAGMQPHAAQLPLVLFKLGLAYDLAGRKQDAISTLKSFYIRGCTGVAHSMLQDECDRAAATIDRLGGRLN